MHSFKRTLFIFVLDNSPLHSISAHLNLHVCVSYHLALNNLLQFLQTDFFIVQGATRIYKHCLFTLLELDYLKGLRVGKRCGIS